MNRETKRAMARQQRTTDTGERAQQLRKQQLARQRVKATTPAATRTGGRGLKGAGNFGSEVMDELRKVAWPNRQEVFGYTVVVLISVSIITAIIFGLDTLFGKAVLAVFG